MIKAKKEGKICQLMHKEGTNPKQENEPIQWHHFASFVREERAVIKLPLIPHILTFSLLSLFSLCCFFLSFFLLLLFVLLVLFLLLPSYHHLPLSHGSFTPVGPLSVVLRAKSLSFLVSFLFFFCLHHRETSVVVAVMPPPALWRPHATGPCTSGATGSAPPSVVVSALAAPFSTRGNQGFPILFHNCGLARVALTRFQSNPKNVQQKTTTTTIVVYTVFLLHAPFSFILGLVHFAVYNKMETLFTLCFFIHALFSFWALPIFVKSEIKQKRYLHYFFNTRTLFILDPGCFFMKLEEK